MILCVVPFFYRSGEQIKLRDRVSLHGEPAEIESIHDPADGVDDWYIATQGGGVMIAEPKVFGHLFVHEPRGCDDLEFVSRAVEIF